MTFGTSDEVAPSRNDGTDVGVVECQLTEQRWSEPAGRRTDHADPGVTGDLVVAARHVGGDVLDLVEHAACSLDDPESIFGEAALSTVDEHDAEFLLQSGDVPGDVRLHREQRTRSGREGPVIGNRDDR